MIKKTILEICVILLMTLFIGIFYNLSSPNRLPFIGREKVIDFSGSDSLLDALRKQDSLLNSADSTSHLREDSLKLASTQKTIDSIASANKKDSLRRVTDSLATARKRTEDSLKAANNFVKPVDIKLNFAKALYDRKNRFIDARDKADFEAGHIQGAVNIPYHELEKNKDVLKGLSMDEVYVVYCSAACDVSIDLAYAMAKSGFKKVYIFHGGWDEWLAAGYPGNTP